MLTLIGKKTMFYQKERVLLFFATLPLALEKLENSTRLQLIFSTFPSCSQTPVSFYHSVIHHLSFFIC